MTTRTVDRLEEWEQAPFSGGYAGLHDLAAEDFSGVVVAGPAQLFMLSGSVVGVLDGDIEDFEDAGGTAREAPHDALPLLAVMQERSEEVRAQYYTEETPISKVDRTLADGNFTGFIELSENVLSGDYYLVYHQGRSMSVAWVGSSSRLITGDEAFEQADGEVGIYEVRPVEVDVIDIPKPEGGSAAGGAGAGGTDTDDGAAGDPGSTASDVDSGAESDGASATDASGADRSESALGSGGVSDDDADDRPTTDRSTTSSQQPPDAKHATATSEGSRTRDRDQGAGSASGGTARSQEAESASTESTSAETVDGDEAAAASGGVTERDAGSNSSDRSSGGGGARGRSEATAAGRDSGMTQSGSADQATQAGADATSPKDLETRSIPSLDPERTATASPQGGGSDRGQAGSAGASAGASTARRDAPSTQSGQSQAGGSADAGSDQRSHQATDERPATDDRSAKAGARESGQASTGDDAAAGASEQSAAPSEDLRAELQEREAEIDRLEAELDDLEAERDDLEIERDRLESELEEAREEIERLRDRLEEAGAAGSSDGERLSPSRAIDETNLFVRYRSKGDPTLEDAHDANADRETVGQNLRLEYHTSFETEGATVDGRPFDDYLTESVQYRFAEWVVADLLYEIRDSGGAGALEDLYDALPKVDRIELNGQVGVTYVEDGQENRGQKRFDVVLRDRMGNPLAVATINDSRDPATEAMMTDLITGAEQVGRTSSSLVGAFLVTESFFEPEALEATEEATSSGLLSRDKRKSFVNLSRKDGYHLCLVEARNSEFHLAVPEL